MINTERFAERTENEKKTFLNEKKYCLFENRLKFLGPQLNYQVLFT